MERCSLPGCGIAEEALERIFKPFEQEQSSSGDSRNFQGMGLGLAVVMEITAMHSAQIRVEPFELHNHEQC